MWRHHWECSSQHFLAESHISQCVVLPLYTSLGVRRNQLRLGCKIEHTHTHPSLMLELCCSKHHSLHQMLQWNSWKIFAILAEIFSLTSFLETTEIHFQQYSLRITKKQNKNIDSESEAKDKHGKFQSKQLV